MNDKLSLRKYTWFLPIKWGNSTIISTVPNIALSISKAKVVDGWSVPELNLGMSAETALQNKASSIPKIACNCRHHQVFLAPRADLPVVSHNTATTTALALEQQADDTLEAGVCAAYYVCLVWIFQPTFTLISIHHADKIVRRWRWL